MPKKYNKKLVRKISPSKWKDSPSKSNNDRRSQYTRLEKIEESPLDDKFYLNQSPDAV